METQITVGVTGHRHLFEADKPRLRDEIRRFFLENFDASQPVRVLDGLAEGLVVEHKEFGTGVIVMLNDRLTAVDFNGRRKVLDLRSLYEKKLLIEK